MSSWASAFICEGIQVRQRRIAGEDTYLITSGLDLGEAGTGRCAKPFPPLAASSYVALVILRQYIFFRC